MNKLNRQVLNDIPSDIIYNVMLNADFETLKHLCQTNKASLKYCKDSHFWYAKLAHQQLPVPNKEMIKQLGWMTLYQSLSSAYKEAKEMLLVNKIESQRQHFRTNGDIVLCPYEYDDLYFINLPLFKEAELLNDPNQFMIEIFIQYNGQYHVKYQIHHQTLIFVKEKTPIDEQTIIHILTLYLLHMDHGNREYEINDHRGWPLRYDPNITDLELQDLTTSLRYITYDTLQYLSYF